MGAAPAAMTWAKDENFGRHAPPVAPNSSFVFGPNNVGGCMRNAIFATLIAEVLAGCQSTPTQDNAAPVEDKSATASQSGASTSGTTGSGVSGTSMSGGNPLRDPNNILSKRSV